MRIKKKINKFFIETNNIQQSSYIWNVIACTSSSFQSMLFLLVISRCNEIEDAAIFSISYSVASLLLFVGKYGVRNFQVSDTHEEFTYGEYRYHRYLTTMFMFFGAIAFVIWGRVWKNYTNYKCLCIMAIIATKIIDAFEDVLQGAYHQKGRLDIASKIWGIRNIIYIFVFCSLYVYTKNLLITSTIGAVVSIILCVLFNHGVLYEFEKKYYHCKEAVILIFKKCFPIALSTTLMAYIANAPKYTIDGIVNNEVQASFSVAFMPVFVMTLLGNYIFNPMVNKLTFFWENREINCFSKLVYKVVWIITVTTTIVLIGCETIGIAALEVLYKVDLYQYNLHMGILIVAGGLLTILNFCVVIATIIRKQYFLQKVIVFGTIICLLFSKKALIIYGILGLVIFFVIVLLIILILAGVGIKKSIKRESTYI